MVVKIVLNQVGVQLLDPRARAGGKSTLQHRSLRLNSLHLNSLRLKSLRLNSLRLNSLHLNSHLYPLPAVIPTCSNQPAVSSLTTHQKHSVANARPSLLPRLSNFWQDRNLTMLSASIDPGNQEIKVCNVFRCQTLVVIHQNAFSFIITLYDTDTQSV